VKTPYCRMLGDSGQRRLKNKQLKWPRPSS
jgi:hypothetical protein